MTCLARTKLSTVSLADTLPAHTAAIVVLVPSPLGDVPLVPKPPAVFKAEAGQVVTVFQGDGVPVILAGVGALSAKLEPTDTPWQRRHRGLGNGRAAGDPRGPVASSICKGLDAAVASIGGDQLADACVSVDFSLLASLPCDPASLSSLVSASVRRCVVWSHKWDLHITDAGGNKSKMGKRPKEIALVKGGDDAASWTDADREAAKRARVAGEAIAFARDANETRAGVGGVRFYCEVAKEVAAASGGALTVEIIDHDALVKMGAGCITAVGQGHPDGSALVLIDYKGNPDDGAPTTALVGKGVVFDTGGMQLKPDPGIRTMFMDMCGAGAVLAAMRALPSLSPRANVTGVMCLSENAIGPLAVHPLDIVKSLKGHTVEIAHTDAEGRLCLADGLCYVERNRPNVETIVDIATLTGAQVVALGPHRAALFSYDDGFAREIEDAARDTCDAVWRMPVGPEHVDAMRSEFADLSNLGKLGRSAGSSTAAAFLGEFVDAERWAHLDIAGPAAEEDGKQRATGAGVDVLINLVTANK